MRLRMLALVFCLYSLILGPWAEASARSGSRKGRVVRTRAQARARAEFGAQAQAGRPVPAQAGRPGQAEAAKPFKIHGPPVKLDLAANACLLKGQRDYLRSRFYEGFNSLAECLVAVRRGG